MQMNKHQTRVEKYYNKSRISPNKCLQYQYRMYFSFAILLQRQYLSHCAILITPLFAIASFLGFMVDEFCIFYCIKYYFSLLFANHSLLPYCGF